MIKRIIAHLDMDAFFASVEERDHEWLHGLPIVVGADPEDGRGRGVVSTANYKARKFGIHSAMPISTAWKLAKEAEKRGDTKTEFLRPCFERYTEVSQSIFSLIREFSSLVEEASVDEVYFDLTHQGSFKEAGNVAEEIKNKIRTQINLTCSVGIGPNKLVAKIASDTQKPDGLTVVGADDEKSQEIISAFLSRLPVRKIPGIGPKTEVILSQHNILTVKHLQQSSPEWLTEQFGKGGKDLYEKAYGKDEDPLREEYESKSIGEQETFQQDTSDAGFLLDRLTILCGEVYRRFSKENARGFRTIVITVRFHDFETLTRSFTTKKTVSSLERFKFEALRLFTPFLDRRGNPTRKLVRLLGVRLEKLQR